jgi:hypothetical protein
MINRHADYLKSGDALWHRLGFPDTFDRWDDDIGGVEWKGSVTALSSSARQ